MDPLWMVILTFALVGSSWQWIMEFKPCQSSEDLAQEKMVKKIK
jgi:hypothetical protein